jgi:4-amino-4-deoxy-L-arabinose transferase-like glycosyltransferase
MTWTELIFHRRFGFWILLGAATVLHLVQLGGPALWSNEGRWAVIAREMIQSGDYFTPTINCELYYDKPLLSYWLVVFFSRIGGGVTEWTVRLPSVLAALIGIWAVVRMGERVCGRGLECGWVLLSTYGFMQWAHRGTSDLLSASLISASVVLFLQSTESEAPWSAIGAWAVMALAAQAKGLSGFAIPVMLLSTYFFLFRSWKKALDWRHACGACLSLFIYASPFLASSAFGEDGTGEGLRRVFTENVQRYFDPFDHRNHVSVYLWSAPLYVAPWCVFWVSGLWELFRKRMRVNRMTAWILVSTALVLGFFALSGSRREYYILPFLPFAVVGTVALISKESTPINRVTSLSIVQIILTVFIVVGLSPVISPGDYRSYFERHATVLMTAAVVVALGAATSAWLLALRHVPPVPGLVPALIAVWIGSWWILAPNLETDDSEIRRFATEVRTKAVDSDLKRFAIHGGRNSCLIFYLNSPTRIYTHADWPDSTQMYTAGIRKFVGSPYFVYNLAANIRRHPIDTIRVKWLPWSLDGHTRSLMYAEFP